MADVESIHLNIEKYPDCIIIANELAKLQQRTAHDAARLLFLNEGRKKIDRLKAEAEAAQSKTSVTPAREADVK